MFKVNRSIMESCKFVVILLLYCVTTAYCYPPKPLNERVPSDMTWQAWLFINEDNQNKQQLDADGMTRRRITPKSVFIAPSFNPEKLPQCADGFSADVKGTCVPIIKIDEAAQYEYLIQKLKDKFGPLDYYDDDDDETEGPFQVNIPLEVGQKKNNGDTEGAIVISPTKVLSSSLDKRDSIDDEKKQEVFLKNLVASTTKKYEETTTSTTEATTDLNEKGSTLTDDLTASTDSLMTTEDITESHNTKRSSEDVEQDITTTTEEEVETTTFDPTTVSIEETSTSLPTVQILVTRPITRLEFKFPEETITEKLIKFPDSDVSLGTQIPPSVAPTTDAHDISNDAPFHHSAETTVNDGQVVFRDQSQPEEANLDYSNGVRDHTLTTTPHNFNRRNRDKTNNMFLLPPRWNLSNFQKPLVLRFSRKYAYLDDVRFKHPDYRTVPMDDYAYLFNRHKPSGHR